MARNNAKLNRAVLATASVVEVVAGAASLIFHVKELREGKTYNVVKDGVRDISSGVLIGNGVTNLALMTKGVIEAKRLEKKEESPDA